MRYIPHTDSDVAKMLGTIGAPSVASLFDSVPEPLQLKRDLELLPALSEQELASEIGLSDELFRKSGELSHGQKQWLEIGMLLMQDPQLLLVDEPVAGMTHHETERTAELLVSLAGKRTVVVVEHDMEFVRSLARQVTVLHEGRVLAEGTMEAVQNDPRVVEVYLGT